MGKLTSVNCPICTKHISRQCDLPRHMKVHSPDKEKLKHRCPVEGCTRGFLQKSNLAIHIATHKGERPYKCPETECSFATADPASLCRHRKRRHGYIPRQRKNGASSTTTTTATTTGESQRQRQRYKPYTPTSARNTSGISGPSTSLLLADQWQAEADPANNFCLVTQPTQVDNSPAHNTHVADAPVLDLKPMITSMASTTMHSQLHIPQDPHATDAAIQPVYDTTLTNGVSDDFLSWFDNWHSPSSHSSPITSSNIEHVATPASLGPYEDDYTVNNLSMLPSASRSPYGSPFIVDNTLIPPAAPQLYGSYEYYGYDTGAMSLDAQFSFPDLSTTLDTSVYPQVFYPGDIGQDLLCDTYAGTSGTSMMGLYMN